jgi:hypothetical protein
MKKLALIVMTVGCGGGGDGGIGDGCSENADLCAGETICIANRCEAAFGRIYSIADVAVSVPTTDPNGQPWDAGGGAPDLRIDILVNGTLLGSAPAVQDEFSATFAGPFNVQLVGGSSLLIAALDEDLTTDDPAFACQATPITASQLRSRTLSCNDGGSTLTFEIDPR